MRISDWSSDVCSSDLAHRTDPGRSDCGRRGARAARRLRPAPLSEPIEPPTVRRQRVALKVIGWTFRSSTPPPSNAQPDRKSVVSRKSVSVRVDLGGRRIIKKKIYKTTNQHKQ